MRIFIVWGEERGDEGAISKCVCVCMAKMKKIRREKLEERKRDYYCLFLLLGGKKDKS